MTPQIFIWGVNSKKWGVIDVWRPVIFSPDIIYYIIYYIISYLYIN